MKNIAVFVNPKSRSGRVQSEVVVSWLRENGFNIVNSNPGCDQNEIARFLKSKHNEIDLVIIGGGDGSLREALPALLENNLPVLYLAIGTLNNLGKSLLLPTEVKDSLEMIKDPNFIEIEIGDANGIPFHSVIGLGLSTQINRFVRSDLKRWIGPLAFVWTGLKIIYRMTPFRIWLVCDGQQHQARSWQLTVCNGRFYGSGFEISPNADLNDHLLHGQSVETEKWWHAFKFLPLLFKSTHTSDKGLKQFAGREIEIRTRASMRVDLDGDVKTKTPLKLTLHPQKLKILVPKQSI